VVRKAAWIVSIFLLLNTGVLGMFSGVNDLADAGTPLQRSVTYGVITYALLGLAAAGALLVRHRSARWLTVGWATVVTYVASAAGPAYAGADASMAGAISGGIGAALVGALVVWATRVSTRAPADGRAPPRSTH
jgi:hypothetical protein